MYLVTAARPTLVWILAIHLLALVPAASGQDSGSAVGASALEKAPPDGPEGSEEAAEVPEEPAVPPLVQQANELIAEYDALGKRIGDLEAKRESADKSDLVVFDRQLIEGKLEYLKLMERAVTNLVAQEKEGLDSTELRAVTEAELRELAPAFQEHIDLGEKVASSIRKRRDEAEATQILQIEQELEREVAWVDRLYRGYGDNIQHREVLGLEFEAERSDYEERLRERTRLQGTRLKLAQEQLKESTRRVAEDPDDTGLNVEKASSVARRDALVASLARLAKMMDAADLDASAEQKLIITSTGEVTSDIFKPEVALSLLEEWLDEVRRWFRDFGPGLLFKLLLFMVIITVARVVSGLSRRVLRRALSTSRMHASLLLQNMAIGIVGNLVLLLGILIGLSQLGLELGPLLAGLGIAGFIVGFALQDSLANFAAGLMILGYRPFDMGDVIEAAGVLGTVNQMSLVNTTILTFDNRTLIVPNNKIWGDVITNMTHQQRRRVDLSLRLGYEQDLDRCEEILRDVLAQDDRILDDPPPIVRLHEFGESAMTIIVRPWTTTEHYWDVYWDVTGAIKRRLDAEGIPIAVPRADVRMQPAPDAGA